MGGLMVSCLLRRRDPSLTAEIGLDTVPTQG